MRTFLLLILFTIPSLAVSQSKADSAFQSVEKFVGYLWNRDHDSTYIASYNDNLNVRLLAVNKFTFFSVRDRINNSQLRYLPELGLNLGVGVTYNWFSVDVAFNIGLRDDKIPDSDFFDFQGVIFSTKFLLDASLKYYYGYQVSANDQLVPDNEKNVRSDIRTINFGLSFMYALRYDRFSIKAPFVFSEIQRKSAGSPVFGVGFTSYTLNSDSSIVGPTLAPEFEHPLSNLEGVNMINLSVNAGYIHSFVVKEKFFLSLGLIPGVTFNAGDYSAPDIERRDLYLSAMTKTIFALGYNSSRWYGGLQLMADFDLYRLEKKMHLVSSHGKSKFYIGYRIRRN